MLRTAKLLDWSDSAKLEVERFLESHDPSYRSLAYYAALPLIITPDLLSFLRTKFLQGKVPWIAEADLLLSDLCRPIGFEQYAMVTSVRAHLLEEVRAQLGDARINEVARFLLKYVQYLSQADSYVTGSELRSQQWAAMVYLENQRESVVRQIAESFRNCFTPNRGSGPGLKTTYDVAELRHLVRITDALSTELFEFPELIKYAEDVGLILAGIKTAADSGKIKSTRILDIRMPSPEPLLKIEPQPEDFGQLLDQFEQEQSTIQVGEVVRGTVVGITERGVLIDFGYKAEGIANSKEFMEEGEIAVKPGDEVDVLVKAIETSDGIPLLSRADAVRFRAWNDLEKAFTENTTVKGFVTERIKGGLRVDIDGIPAFLPGSHIDVRPVRDLDSLRGREIEAKIIKLNRKRSNLVVSRKVVLEERNEGRREHLLEQIEEDLIVEGTVKNLTDYGAFVDLGGMDALLHVTDMSWGRLQNPADLFRVGDLVQAKVLRFDRERERVSLGYKQLLPDPWETVEERFPPGVRTKATVVTVTDYGAFVELEPGVEGLVHVSEMAWSKRVKHPSTLVGPGDAVEVEVLTVDPKARRISLSMKSVQDNPWGTLAEKYHVGSRVQGRVRNLTAFGAFVEIEDGVDALVHISDISWTRLKHPGEVLKKGQQIEAVITAIDTGNRRMSLSIKDAEPTPWDKFVNAHKPGDFVTGKIVRLASFGAFVELAENLEGLCHITELSDQQINSAEDVVQVGQEIGFLILRIDPENRKIGLSHRAVRESPSRPDLLPNSSN